MFSFLGFFGLSENLPLVSGSFVQTPLYLLWDEERWNQEIEMYRNLGMKYIILQSVITEKWIINDPNKGEADWKNYKLDTTSETNNHIVYPSKIFTHYYYSGFNSIEFALKSCKKYGLQVWIGPIGDDRWFQYGYYEERNELFTEWSENYTARSALVFSEIWEMYPEYHSQIAGFYFHSEFSNFYFPSLNIQYEGVREKWATIYGAYLHNFDQMISKITSNTKPMMFSPYVNFNLTTSSQFEGWLTALVVKSELRESTVLAPQDSMGSWYSQKKNELEEWTLCEYRAAKAGGIKFWINNENFRIGSDFPAPFVEFEDQISKTNIADTHIVFSISHYGSNLSAKYTYEQDREWYNTFLQYIIEHNKTNTTTGPQTESSFEIITSSSSNNSAEERLLAWAIVVIVFVSIIIVIGSVILTFIFIRRKRENNSYDLPEEILVV